jgi:hypothetical protein
MCSAKGPDAVHARLGIGVGRILFTGVCVEGSASIECKVSRECGIVFVDGVEANNALHVSPLGAVVGSGEAGGSNSMADAERSAVRRSLTRNAWPPEASD